ncbi:hypothetical protein LR010_01015 [Candidatus Gracilibacteria bacterium]|nr:hypothetical protein [Candidatus Gracilibacteria bacterium]
MELLIDLFYSVLFIAGGISIIKYRRNVKSWTGNWLWAEKILGSGGTYVLMILIGLFLIFFGVIYPFGGMEFLLGNDQIDYGV